MNSDQERLSIVTGCWNFRSEAVVATLPQCGEPKYGPVVAGDFISERAAMHRLDYTDGKTEEGPYTPRRPRPPPLWSAWSRTQRTALSGAPAPPVHPPNTTTYSTLYTESLIDCL